MNAYLAIFLDCTFVNIEFQDTYGVKYRTIYLMIGTFFAKCNF